MANGYIPSTLDTPDPQTLPDSPVIPGSGVGETADLQRITPGAIPSDGSQDGQEPLGDLFGQGAATPLPAPPPERSKLQVISDALHLFGQQFKEIAQPELYHGATAGLRESMRKRNLEEAGRQDLAYTMALYQIGTPDAMTALQKRTPRMTDPTAIKLAGEAIKDIQTRARLSDILDKGDQSGRRMAAMLRAGVPANLVPVLAKEMYNEDNPLNTIKTFEGGYLYWDRKAQKVQTVSDPRVHSGTTDPANRRFQDAVSISVSGKPLATLMEEVTTTGDLGQRALLSTVLQKLGDKNLTNDIDRLAYTYAREQKVEGVNSYKDLADKDPKAAREVFKQYEKLLEERTGATGLAAALARGTAALEENPLVKHAKTFYRVDSLKPGEVASPVSTSYKNLLAGIDKNEIVAIQTDKQMETIKGMEDLEQFLLPEMRSLAKKLPREAGLKTLVSQLTNPWARYLGVPNEAIQQQGASGAFAIYLAKVFQGGAAALSDADRKAAELLTVHDGDTAGSALIKIGIMSRIAGIRKMVAAGLNPRQMGVSAYTDAEVAKLEQELRGVSAELPLGPGVRIKRAR